MWRLLTIVVISLTGCVPQSNMIHSPDQVVFEPRLIGTWQIIEGDPRLTFDICQSPHGDKTYRILISDAHPDGKGHMSECGAQLSRIDGKDYLTLGNDGDPQIPQKYYTVVIYEWEPKLRVRILNHLWLHQAINLDPSLITHRGAPKKGFLVTAPSQELLAFFQKHLNDKDAGSWVKYVLAKKE